MKPRKQKCSRCDGRKTIQSHELTSIELNEKITKTAQMESFIIDCPDCEGEGEEVLISPRQWREYELFCRMTVPERIEEFFRKNKGKGLEILKDAGRKLMIEKPLDAVSENKGKISIS